MIRRALRRPVLSSITALTAAGIAAGGLVLTSNDTSQAAETGLTVQLAPSTPTPTVQDPKPVAGAQRLEAAAAAHRAALKKIAEKKAAAEKAARERRAERLRASRAAERKRLLSTDPRSAARALLGDFGFSSSQFGCLDSLWQKESGWNVHASNRSSGAYGIPQALPGGKMASAGSDWRTNPVTQIKWGLGYIKSTYGTPCAAWSHSRASGWY
ncbi:MAG: lytic transglycosylase domain-containing protein [Angustibacter sp.]